MVWSGLQALQERVGGVNERNVIKVLVYGHTSFIINVEIDIILDDIV